MKALLHKNFFTLVEVLLAMGICVVGLCSVVVFFPIGANASRNASMASYAATTAEQILDFAKLCIEADPGTNVPGKGSFIAFRYFTSPTGLLSDNGWNAYDLGSYDDHAPEQPTANYADNEKKLEQFLTDVVNSNSYAKEMAQSISTMLSTPTEKTVGEGSDQIEINTDLVAKIIPCKNKVFYVEFSSPDADDAAAYEDFNCYAAIGAEPIYASSETSSGQKIPFSVRLNVEVSWPATLEYDQRQKRTYSMDIFKAY